MNRLLNAEADQPCNAGCDERSAERSDSRAGSYQRKLQTKASNVELKMSRLRSLPFEIQIIERYKFRESSAEEAFLISAKNVSWFDLAFRIEFDSYSISGSFFTYFDCNSSQHARSGNSLLSFHE